MHPWQVFGLTGLTYSPDFPGQTPSVYFGFRTCSPLRGSSGLPPDSLFILLAEEPRNCTTISRSKWKCNTTRCEYLAMNQNPHTAASRYFIGLFEVKVFEVKVLEVKVCSWFLSATVRRFLEQSRSLCNMAVCRSGYWSLGTVSIKFDIKADPILARRSYAL
jgi:hypothetical protein